VHKELKVFRVLKVHKELLGLELQQDLILTFNIILQETLLGLLT